MAVNVNDVVQAMQFYSAKKQSSMISPDEINILFKAVNLDYLKYLVGLPEQYTPGQPMAPVQYQLTQQITDRVYPFIKKLIVPRATSGFFPIPVDYFAFSSIRYRYVSNATSCGGNPFHKALDIRVVMDEEVNDILFNTICPPTLLYPICAYYLGGLEVWPHDILSVIFTYLKRPVTPVWGFTVVNDEPVYNPATSTDFEWPDMCLNDITIMCLKYIGINLESQELIGFAINRDNKGK